MMTAALDEAVAPPSADYSKVPKIGMHLNDTWGCCVISADANVVQQQSFYGQGAEIVVPDTAVLQAYKVAGHFVLSAGPPGDNPTDNGMLIPDGLGYLLKTGMSGIKIAGYGQVRHVQTGKIKTAIYQFGCVSFGVNLPNSAMSQFDHGLPWDYVHGADNNIAGGHCVMACGYNATGFLVMTWGRVVPVTWAWWAKFGAEAWPIVSQEWVNAVTGKDPVGVDLVKLGTEFRAVTGHNPFLAPQPPAPVALRAGLEWWAVTASEISTYIAIFVFLAAVVGGLVTYLLRRRGSTGTTDTSEAGTLWQQSQSMFTSVVAERDKAMEQRDRLMTAQSEQTIPILSALLTAVQQLKVILDDRTEMFSDIQKSLAEFNQRIQVIDTIAGQVGKLSERYISRGPVE
jgi:hypothetical protein